MSDIVALRMDSALLEKIDTLGEEELADRSTIIRLLIDKGYRERLKEKAVQLYKEGKITFSEAAYRAGLTLWEMQHYLIDQGFTSAYSLEDLEQEMKVLMKIK